MEIDLVRLADEAASAWRAAAMLEAAGFRHRLDLRAGISLFISPSGAVVVRLEMAHWGDGPKEVTACAQT